MGVYEQQTFSSKVDYKLILDKLREEFNKKFSQNTPSMAIGLDNYEIKATLGAGSFGKVQMVKEKSSGNYYASKQLSKDQIMKTKQVAHVMSEKRVLRSIFFPFTVYLVASFKDNDSLYLILPIVPGGELFTYHRKVRKFSEKQARFYAAQVFLALEYLHHCSLLYRDLKPENIMIDKNGYLKVTDFGFAKKVETRTMTLCGTPEYLPPEIIQSKPYGTSVDWWAFGVLVFEFVAGHSPFSSHNRDMMSMYNKICECDYKMPSYFSGSLRHLVDHLLQVDLSKRQGKNIRLTRVLGDFDFLFFRYGNLINGNKDIKDHEWFKDIDWIPLLNQSISPPYIPTISNPEDISHFDKISEGKPKTKAKTMRHEEIFADF